MFSIVLFIGYIACLAIGMKSDEDLQYKVITYNKSIEEEFTDDIVWQELQKDFKANGVHRITGRFYDKYIVSRWTH